MKRIGLLGWPVAHSVSPAMHNAAFEALGMSDWQYDLLPVEPDDLNDRVSSLIEAGYRGFNVTIPHKRAMLEMIDRKYQSESVRAIGAANTLIVRDGVLHAENTDWEGFRDDLMALGIDVRYRPCAILGTGGAAKAVDYALGMMGADPIFQVTRAMPAQPGLTIGYGGLVAVSGNSLIVNATPVGMHPQINESPWPKYLGFPQAATLYDLIYNPSTTRLMMQMRAAGARAYGGLGMLIRQAELSFELWTGQNPPEGVMRAAALAALNLSDTTGEQTD